MRVITIARIAIAIRIAITPCSSWSKISARDPQVTFPAPHWPETKRVLAVVAGKDRWLIGGSYVYLGLGTQG